MQTCLGFDGVSSVCLTFFLLSQYDTDNVTPSSSCSSPLLSFAALRALFGLKKQLLFGIGGVVDL